MNTLDPWKLKTADEILEDVNAALKSEFKAHDEYRKAPADDCIVGVCSMNNCLYPVCSEAGKAELARREQVRREASEVKVTYGQSMLFDGDYSGYTISDKSMRRTRE